MTLDRHEGRGLDGFVAAAERPLPVGEVDHGAVVVAEMAEQPPEPLGAAERAVGDDEDARFDPAARRDGGKLSGGRQRVPAARAGCGRELAIDVDESCAGNVCGEIELPAESRIAERPAAVDEPVAHV